MKKRVFGPLFFVGLLFSILIVVYTSERIFDNPQLEPDDYRYLALVEGMETGEGPGFLDAMTVENRWDELWWIAAEQKVRFFRPLVFLSYVTDAWFHGDNVIAGLLLTNILLHAACVLATCLLAFVLLGHGIPALVSSLLFASFWCHGEVMWYVAGRTETIAALGFLLGFAFHLLGGRTVGTKRTWLRSLAVAAFGVAFLTKELTVLLPVLLVLGEHLLERRDPSLIAYMRREHRLISAYFVVGLAIQGLRLVVFAGKETQLVFPYFVSPFSARFWPHLWTQFRTYTENLLLAQPSNPFLQFDGLSELTSPLGLLLGIAFVIVFSVFALRDRASRLFLVFAVLTWLPTSFVYVSERYLYLPSCAVALFFGRCIQVVPRIAKPLLVALGGLWIWHQAYGLELKNAYLMREDRSPAYIGKQALPIRGRIEQGAKILIVNYPGDWLGAQFLEAQFRVQLANPSLSLRVLTLAPKQSLGKTLRVAFRGERSLRVSTSDGSPVIDSAGELFEWQALAKGREIQGEKLGFRVFIEEGTGKSASALRFDLDAPCRSYRILEWRPNPFTPFRRQSGSIRLVN